MATIKDHARRLCAPLLNPLEADRPHLATTLLPGLLEALSRNVSRGAVDTARSLMSAQPLMLSFFIFRRPPMSRMHLYVSRGQRETSSDVREVGTPDEIEATRSTISQIVTP